MAHVIVVQHEPGEGPGALLPALKAAALQARLVRTWIEEPMPAVPGAASGVVVLGGGASAVPDRRPAALEAEIALLRASCQAGLPVLGLCLGGQLLAAALGAEVARAPRREVGFLRVRLSEAAGDDALFAGLPVSFVAFHFHEDEFALPAGATALASSTQTPVQAFRAGSAWGIQFHPEVTQAELSAMVASAPQDLRDAGADPVELLEAGARELPRMESWRGPLFARWAALAAGRTER
jgi:GMP synthase (glutamine-hydrolysing)